MSKYDKYWEKEAKKNIDKIYDVIEEDEEGREIIHGLPPKAPLYDPVVIKKPLPSTKKILDIPFDRFMNKRSIKSYPVPVLDNLKLVSLNENAMAMPFGSYTYRFQAYPGDIDGMEEIGECCSEADAAKKYAKAIQTVVMEIKLKKMNYYSEIKAGIDPIYNITVGALRNGIFTPNPKLWEKTQSLYDKNLFPVEEYSIIMSILTKDKQLDGDDYDVVEYIYRKYRILRWTADEILKGYKILEDGSKLKLVDAITMDTMTKIDQISLIDGRFVEITNNWHLNWIDENDEWHVFNKKHGVPNDLTKEVDKLYFSNMFYSPFKCLKRMYSYSRYKYIDTGDKKWKYYIKTISPFLMSRISSAYQIKSELDTIVLILTLNRNASPGAISNQINYTKQRISSILEFSDEQVQEMNKNLDIVYIYSTAKSHVDIQLKQLDKVIKMLKGLINYHTIGFLERMGLNPPPRDLLPNPRGYADVVRKPTDDPVNPMKIAMAELVETIGEGCNMCGGEMFDCGGQVQCMQCRDNPQIQLANMLNHNT